MDIAFPHLNIYLENVPKNFTVFGFTIALYGVVIGLGALLGVMLVAQIAKKTNQDPDLYWDLAIYLLVFSIIGARLYYVIFAWDMYKDNLISILQIRNGGLAIYGGIITGFITLFFYTRIKKKSYFLLADTGVFGVIVGQIFGRWGNFTNREAFGEYTDGLFAMRLPLEAIRSGEITEEMWAHVTDGINYVQVSPTFLYESSWNLMILIIMLLYIKHKKFDGEVCLLYLGGYGLGRMWIEGLRTDQLLIPGTTIPVSQLLAVCLVLFALTTDIVVRVLIKKGKIKPANNAESLENTNEN
ncbi:MAG: prolipoprotein diacylglyceryl transferase [Butyrivibrio sp.]|nr:prolipoprotein diacylglyceryl transferase [Butyrivibrio sp.]